MRSIPPFDAGVFKKGRRLTPVIEEEELVPATITNGRQNQRARRENRSTNGTAIFRRTSTTSFAQSNSQADPPLPTPTAETSSLHQPSANFEHPSDNYRYSKESLLGIYQQLRESGTLKDDASHLYAENWNPEQSSVANGQYRWGRQSESRDSHGPDVCWNKNADTEPMALQDMTEEEKTVG